MIRNTDHLRWIASLPCLVTGKHECEAAHIRYSDARYAKINPGIGCKPDDFWVVPLNYMEHRRQHSMGERLYWTSVGIDPLPVALLLWAHTGDTEAAGSIIRILGHSVLSEA